MAEAGLIDIIMALGAKLGIPAMERYHQRKKRRYRFGQAAQQAQQLRTIQLAGGRPKWEQLPFPLAKTFAPGAQKSFSPSALTTAPIGVEVGPPGKRVAIPPTEGFALTMPSEADAFEAMTPDEYLDILKGITTSTTNVDEQGYILSEQEQQERKRQKADELAARYLNAKKRLFAEQQKQNVGSLINRAFE